MQIQFIHLCLIIFYSYFTHQTGIFPKCEKDDLGWGGGVEPESVDLVKMLNH